MRNTTFISSMVLSVACVSAANAAVTPIDTFLIADAISPSAPTATTGYNYSAGSESSQPYGMANSRQLIGSWNASGGGTANGSNSVETGAMTMSYGGTATTGTNKWFNTTDLVDGPDGQRYYSYQTSKAVWGYWGGTIDMGNVTGFSFDLSGYQTTGTLNNAKMYLDFQDDAGVTTFSEVALSNGHVYVDCSNWVVDWDSIRVIQMVFTNTLIGSDSLNYQAAGVAPPTGTVTVSNFGVVALGVPAPGAIALLGAAGLIGARRRRA